MRRVSLFFLCFGSRLRFVSLSFLSRFFPVFRVRKVKFCEVLRTDLFFSFSVSQTLAFSCFFFAQKSGFDRFSKSQVFSGFLVLSYQSAIGQANRRRTERAQLSANRHKRTFPNLFRAGLKIGKDDEAGNVARLNHQSK